MPILRWIIGLAIPGLLLCLVGLGAMWFEYRTQLGAVRLGEYLLLHNRDRLTRGAVWQGILATRQSRTKLENRTRPNSLKLDTMPAALLRYRYEAEQPSPDFIILHARKRALSLRLDQLSSREIQHLAHALQIYQHGELLLSQIQLPREIFHLQAQIQAQIAVENGSIFPLLHRQLKKANAPEAWDFVKISPADLGHWQDYLERFFLPQEIAEPQSNREETSALASACAELLQTWADSLYTGERRRLRKTWTGGADLQIRLVRNLDTFSGYAIVADDPPIRFTLPRDRLPAMPGLDFTWEQNP